MTLNSRCGYSLSVNEELDAAVGVYGCGLVRATDGKFSDLAWSSMEKCSVCCVHYKSCHKIGEYAAHMVYSLLIDVQ